MQQLIFVYNYQCQLIFHKNQTRDTKHPPLIWKFFCQLHKKMTFPAQLLNPKNSAGIGAICIGSLYVSLAVNMSLGYRVGLYFSKSKVIKNQETNESSTEFKERFKSDKFKVYHKTQLNIAEYTGIYLSLLLYIQSTMNHSNSYSLSKFGLYSIYLSVLGQYTFCYGYISLTSLKQKKVVKSKFYGAIMRYIGIAGLIYEVFRTLDF